MSVAAPLKKPGSAIVRSSILTAIAIAVVGLQVALPWISYRLAGTKVDEQNGLNDSSEGNAFLRERLRFTAFLEPQTLHRQEYEFASATVFKNELIILLHKYHWRGVLGVPMPSEIVRVNLRTRQMSVTYAPKHISHVVSDDKTLWWLPNVERANDPFKLQSTNPFVFDGRPVAIAEAFGTPAPLHQLMEFVDEAWRETDQFVLFPPPYSTPDRVQIYRGQFYVFCDTFDRARYYKGLRTASRERAIQFSEQLRPVDDDWTRAPFDDPSRPGISFSLSIPFGHWFEDGLPCAIDCEVNDEAEIVGFKCLCYQKNGHSDLKSIRSPIPWGGHDVSRSGLMTNAYRVVTSSEGAVFLVSCDIDLDGRLHVLRMENSELKLIAQRGSPQIAWVCLDAGLLISLVLMLPMLVLGLCSYLLQRKRSWRQFSSGYATVILASVARRGVARMVDIFIFVSFLVCSVVLHPEVIGWWNHVARCMQSMYMVAGLDFLWFPSWATFVALQNALQRLASEFGTVPIIWWLFVLAIAFGVAQIIWQARCGRTLGKWLLGLKVIRTTLRPCGFARSLLREILLVIDSAFLLSWIPGVICIFATRNSQRIGDVLADTIVVRDLPRRRERNPDIAIINEP